MTYNFDPDRWYENERRVLEMRIASGKLAPDRVETALSSLDQRYDEMVKRLDGTYQLPESGKR